MSRDIRSAQNEQRNFMPRLTDCAGKTAVSGQSWQKIWNRA